MYHCHTKGGNLHGLGMLRAMTSSPEPSFRASWRVGDAVVLGGQHQRADIPAHTELLAKASPSKDWKKIFPESSVMSSRHPNQSRDWAEPNWLSHIVGGAGNSPGWCSTLIWMVNRTLHSTQLLHSVCCDTRWRKNIWYIFNDCLFAFLRIALQSF